MTAVILLHEEQHISIDKNVLLDKISYFQSYFDFTSKSQLHPNRVEIVSLNEFELIKRVLSSDSIANYLPFHKSIVKSSILSLFSDFQIADYYGCLSFLDIISSQIRNLLNHVLKCLAKSDVLMLTRLTCCKSVSVIPLLLSKFKIFHEIKMIENLTIMREICVTYWHLVPLQDFDLQSRKWLFKSILDSITPANALSTFAKASFVLSRYENQKLHDEVTEISKQASALFFSRKGYKGFSEVASQDKVMIHFLVSAQPLSDPLPFLDFFELIKEMPSSSYASLLNGIEYLVTTRGTAKNLDHLDKDPIYQLLFDARNFLISRVGKRYMSLDLSQLNYSILETVSAKVNVSCSDLTQ